MKSCPTCNSTFNDEQLIYCTTDGTVLARVETPSSLESQPTAILPEPPPTLVMPPPRPTEYVGGSAHAPQPPQPYGWANETPPTWVPPPPPRPFSGIAANQQQTLAIVSLIFGLVGITFGWICGGPIFGFFAVILGAIALTQIKRNPVQYGGKGPALVGLITGGIVLLIYLAIIAIWVIALIISAASK